MFSSVFHNLTDVRESVESGRIDSQELVVNIDKHSLGVFLNDEDQYFDGFDSDEYYMSPGGEHERQVLFYKRFDRPEELCVELLSEVLSGENYESVSYRGDESSTNFM